MMDGKNYRYGRVGRFELGNEPRPLSVADLASFRTIAVHAYDRRQRGVIVQNTFGCVIVRRGASRLSGLMVADWAQKLRTKACRLVSPVVGFTSPSWFPGIATIGA